MDEENILSAEEIIEIVKGMLEDLKEEILEEINNNNN
jgi:hypothetical protein|tara:strand:+ start:19 stop:129 length:111 start_codon:yes stop_codon:yes gene_type:complete